MISVMIDDSAAVVEPWKKEYLPTMLAKYREYQTTSKKRKGDLVISSLQRKVDIPDCSLDMVETQGLGMRLRISQSAH